MDSISPFNTTGMPATTRNKWIIPVLVVVVICLCSVSMYFVTRKDSSSSQASKIPYPPIVPPLIPPASPTVDTPTVYDPQFSSTIQPTGKREEKLMEVSMEYMLLPGHAPGKDGTLVQRPAANPVYSLVSCGTSSGALEDDVAIRWDGKYLTVATGSIVRWENRKIGASCFKVVSSFCSDTNYVMFRHRQSGKFLRAAMENDPETLYSLVCKDSPTTGNYRLFCWKFASDIQRKNMYSQNECGCRFDPISGTEVCKNCNGVVSNAPPLPSISIGPFPELVGFELDRAKQWLSVNHPELTIVEIPCSSTPCDPVRVNAPNGKTVVLFFNPLDRRVIQIPQVQ